MKKKKMPKTRTISAPGKKPITFHPGGLHKSLGVAQGKPIPAKKKAAALAGRFGKKAAAQARFAKNVLTGGKRKKKKGVYSRGGMPTASKAMQKKMGFRK